MAAASARGRAWNRICKQVLAEEPNCWLCGQPLDFHATPRTHWAPSVDHIIPVSQGGPILHRSNLRAAHYGHNRERGNRDVPILHNSRRW